MFSTEAASVPGGVSFCDSGDDDDDKNADDFQRKKT